MPSSMLEQAVIDAEALKEAAVKNAEQTILEKYSTEIKDAVSSLLEQEEDEFGMEDEMAGEDREDVVDQLDMAATEGEKLCPCPEEGEQVELDLDQLIAAAESEEEEEMDMGAPAGNEEELFEIDDDELLAESDKADKDYDDDGDIESEEDEWKGSRTKAIKKAQEKEDESKTEGVEKIAARIFEDSGDEEKRHYKDNRKEDDRHLAALKKDVKYDDDAPGEDASEEEKEHYRRNREADKKHITNLEKDKRYDDEHEPLEEELDLSDEQFNDILEALVVDIENVPSGMLFHTHPTEGESKRGLNVALAHEQDTAYAEEQKELRDAIKKLQEQVKSQTLELNKQKKDYINLKSIAVKATKKLEEVNFSNAKLIYTNRILKSDSLNERQKEKLVEALSKVGSVEEAKIVFDTLKENLSTKSNNNAPKTLNEAVSKSSLLILKSNTEKLPANSSQVDRLKRLAGII